MAVWAVVSLFLPDGSSGPASPGVLLGEPEQGEVPGWGVFLTGGSREVGLDMGSKKG